MIAPVMAYVTAGLPDQNRGHPADWFTAFVFLLAALAVSRRFFRTGENVGALRWGLSGLCLLASVGFVVAAPGFTFVSRGAVDVRPLLFAGVGLLSAATWAVIIGAARQTLILVAGVGLLIALWFLLSGLFFQ